MGLYKVSESSAALPGDNFSVATHQEALPIDVTAEFALPK